MKRGTPDHPKMHDLCAALNLPLYSAAGILELLWHFASKYAQQGDIGRHADKAIARAIGWRGSAEKLISALVACRWLDRDDRHRLLVHDWQDHADQTVVRYLKFHKLEMLAPCQHETSGELPLELAKTSQPIAYSQSPNANRPTPAPLPPSPAATDDFDQFWEAYPKKVGKKDAQRAWKKAKDKPDIDTILDAVAAQGLGAQWHKEDGQYIPEPATWINKGRWGDEPPPPFDSGLPEWRSPTEDELEATFPGRRANMAAIAKLPPDERAKFDALMAAGDKLAAAKMIGAENQPSIATLHPSGA